MALKNRNGSHEKKKKMPTLTITHKRQNYDVGRICKRELYDLRVGKDFLNRIQVSYINVLHI